MEDPFYKLLRPILYQQDPENIHHRVLTAIKSFACMPGFQTMVRQVYRFEHPALATQVWGRRFVNPIGVAAGFDKDGLIYNPLLALGFGYVEIGTVTPEPQPGNPKPRIFRLVEDQAVINRLGFNNQGLQALETRLKKQKAQGILGINVGKNKVTALDKAVDDYVKGIQVVYPYADYLTVNISSPNTEGLRDLQSAESLEWLLTRVLETREHLKVEHGRSVPLLVKIAPDLNDQQLQDIVLLSRKFAIDGLIATNTTLAREGLSNRQLAQETGGLSGKPLMALSTRILSDLYRELKGSIPLIGVGGVSSGEDAYRKIRAGANLVQLYTGFIYRGPASVKLIKKELVQCLKRDGYKTVTEAVGDAN